MSISMILFCVLCGLSYYTFIVQKCQDCALIIRGNPLMSNIKIDKIENDDGVIIEYLITRDDSSKEASIILRE